MKTDEAIQQDVQQALRWQPELDAAAIGVTVQDGIVTLTGIVDQYGKKEAAESAVRHIRGVRAIVEGIHVNRNHHQLYPTDQEIARAILDAYKWRWDIPEKQIRIRVEDGCVTLEGEVAWHYQKEAAREVAARLLGVKSIRNRITIRPSGGHLVRAQDIEGALWRNPDIDDEDIRVEAHGNKVILSGSVPSLAQKEEAARMAWSAPGVEHVENLLEVS